MSRSVFVNGVVFTADPAQPFAESFRVVDGVIDAVGSSAVLTAAEEVLEVVDLNGAFVMPGFVDAHNHYHLQGQTELFELLVPSDLGLEDLLSAIDQRARELAEGEWLVVSPYSALLAPELESESALRLLDAVSHGHPVMVREYSRHNRWVNSRALELAKISRDTPDPEHGMIVRDPSTGGLTGVLYEAAGIPVEHAFLADRGFTVGDHGASVRRGVEILNSYGVTAFQDGGASITSMRGAAALDRAGELSAWIVSSMPVNEQIFGFESQGDPLIEQAEPTRTEHHLPDFIKIFMDGVPPARTAVFLDPYPTAEGSEERAEPLFAEDELVRVLQAAAAKGLGAKVHCTGDGSVQAALNGIERVRAAGDWETPFQIAHAQFIDPQDIRRFGELGVVCEISPYYWVPGPVSEAIGEIMGPELVSRMHPNRDLVDQGALVVVGSDWPCSDTPNPWLAVHGLVNRTDPTGETPGVLNPEQAVTLDEALRMATIDGARAIGISGQTGSIAPGKSADFIVVSDNPFAISPENIGQLRVRETWFAGRRV